VLRSETFHKWKDLDEYDITWLTFLSVPTNMFLKTAAKPKLAGSTTAPRDFDLERRDERFLEDWRDLDLFFGLDVARFFVVAEDFLDFTERLVEVRPRPEGFSLLPLVDTRVRGLESPFFPVRFGSDLALDLDLTMALRDFDRAVLDAVLERDLLLAAARKRVFMAAT